MICKVHNDKQKETEAINKVYLDVAFGVYIRCVRTDCGRGRPVQGEGSVERDGGRYSNNKYCDYNLKLAFDNYTYFLEYNVIVI